MTIELIHADCLDVDWPQVDAIITDVPYGTTACKWDVIIPFDKMWAKIKSSLKPRGAFVTTASQPFTSALVMSNLTMFCDEWILGKNRGGDIFNVKNRPLKRHENILIFSEGNTTYNPQGLTETNKKRGSKKNGKLFYDKINKKEYIQKFENYPDTYLYFPISESIHPTQKPVALYEYLIKTYTNEGDTVLDFCMGSGTTGVACQNTGRNFIGIEKDEKYYNIAKQRLEENK